MINILATLFHHGIRREELCRLRLREMESRQGVMHCRIKGKRDKIYFIAIRSGVLQFIGEYLQMAAGAWSTEQVLTLGQAETMAPVLHLGQRGLHRGPALQSDRPVR